MKRIVFLSALWMGYLIWEAVRNRKARACLRHVVHVNGTRGKSTVSRLIEAGLRAGGVRVFCKTTGTDPMTIDVMGREEPVRRRGRANIKEQIAIVRRAAEQNAQVLVVECMAVRPEYQYTAQHSILKADVGVITNVRRDHTDFMGDTLEEICDALCNTVPKDGVLFTAKQAQAERMAEQARRRGSAFFQALPDGSEPDFDFPENIALALKESKPAAPAAENNDAPAVEPAAEPAGESAGLTEAIAEQPILLTSGGQSADYQMIGTVLKKLEMNANIDNLATSASLGDAKTLIVVVGGSSKGLGAAGIDADGELARLNELVDGAKNAGLTVIAMHTGGSARRGELSDKFITPVFEKADYAIVVETGDTDGLMSGICAQNGIPVDVIACISDVTTVLPNAFK